MRYRVTMFANQVYPAPRPGFFVHEESRRLEETVDVEAVERIGEPLQLGELERLARIQVRARVGAELAQRDWRLARFEVVE
jgi:hypothetical protein